MMGIIAQVMFLALFSCATLRNADKSLPENYAGLSMPELVAITQKHGGNVLRKVYHQLQKDNMLAAAGHHISTIVQKDRHKYDLIELAGILHLYQLTADPDAPLLFKLLTAEKNPIMVQMGWQIATIMPSQQMKKAIEQKINIEITRGREQGLFTPQAANAILANRVTNVYTVLREGLRHTHHEAFARAMSEADPKRAAEDFVEYLSRASAEDLRQQAPTMVNVYACTLMLQHLKTNRVSVYHRKFDTLFRYAISRNPVLADWAAQVLSDYYGNHADYLAQMLARLPYWAQFAYVEKLGKKLTPSSRKFLVVLKEKTSGVDVIDEINQVIR